MKSQDGKSMKRKCLAVGIILLFVWTSIIPSTAQNVEKPSLLTQYGNHAPIRINGNDEFTTENGVTGGSGTANDPYRIENWVIVSDNSTSQGIFINDTDAYFVIRNCSVSGFHYLDEFRQGINLSEVTNGKIEDTTASECPTGISIRSSTENEIINCTCSDGSDVGYGIAINRSTNITILSSNCYNMYGGIEINESSDIIIKKTECYNNTYSGLVSNDVGKTAMRFLIEDCMFYNDYHSGIILSSSTQHSSYSIIRNCSFYQQGSGQGSGITLSNICNIIIENCVFYRNAVGLYIVYKSNNNSIRNCSFLSQFSTGVWIKGNWPFNKVQMNNEISYCDFFDNGLGNDEFLSEGIFISSARGTKIHHCNISNNWFRGISSQRSFAQINSNNIFNNNIYDAGVGAGVYSIRSFLDLRSNWWGTSQGPNITMPFFPLRITDHGDTVLYGRGLILFRPWLSELVPNAGRQTLKRERMKL
jgi:parallel beta-helix repeat protein